MVGEAAGIGVLFAGFATGLVHQQPVENIGRFVDRGWNGLSGERSELIRHMGVGFQPRLMAVFRIHEVHRFALPSGGKELPVAGGRVARAPESGHWQFRLPCDHCRQCAIDRLALDMPARQPGELEIVVGIRGLGHLS